MKRTFLAVLLISGFFSSQASVNISYDPVQATIDEHFVINLPATQVLAEVYVVDISKCGFNTEEQLQAFCRSATDQNVIFRGNFAENKLFVSPQSATVEGVWSVVDWNNYFENRAVKLEALFKTILAQ